MANETSRPLKVFLCHASGDKPAVRDLYKRLIAEGVDAWLDEEKLLPGQDWNDEILRALQESDAIIICLSKMSVSKEGYVQREIKEALEKAKEKPSGAIFVIPSKLDDCEIPNYLRQWQWVDLFAENGFVKLLRSLKIRADRVGATVEPLGYESEDKEIERKLNQLYTDGLAAFYTEDWDRAYQRFQTILSQRPNHKPAAEKLAEAERHRNLAKLYAQAEEAYKTENWPAAIRWFEELVQKSADYKDAAQLLRDAKKQKRLKDLYTEAGALHAAQKWHAVLKVFEQIAAIEPTYPDPEGLLPSAQKEAAELKRLADLNDLYSQGIHKMDAGEWYEARSLLEQVHKAQTGFLDTERLLRKIENEILRIEERRKRDAQVQMLYEQARKMTRAGQWGKALVQIEEILKLDNQFVDSDGILEKSKGELGREEQEAQRRRELAALYAEAVSLLEAKKYQEALENWNQIQAIDPKYKDTARVKITARRRLDELSRPEVVGRSWPKIISNWIKAEANIPVDRQILTERLLLLSFASVVIIHVILSVTANWLHLLESDIGSGFFSILLLSLWGVVVAVVYKNAMYSWRSKSSLILIIGWALGSGVALIVERYFAEGFRIVFTVSVALSSSLAMKWAKVSAGRIIIIFIFWVLAWRSGHLLGDYLGNTFSTGYTWAIADAFAILLGLLFTFGIQVEESWEVLRTVFFGALGFAVGNCIAYIMDTMLSFPAETSFALWGLIGGAILEVPSRNTRRITVSAGICCAGLLVGTFITKEVLPNFQYANIAYQDRNNIIWQIIWGAGIGLVLGALVQRPSAIGVMVILGAGMFMVTRALNAGMPDLSDIWKNILRGALIGLVLGYGYGYMANPNLRESKLLVTKTKKVLAGIVTLLAIVIPLIIWFVSPARATSPRWDFDNSTESWGDDFHSDLAIPDSKDGYLLFDSTGTDPYISSPISLNISASQTPVITVRMRIVNGQGSFGSILFLTNQDSDWGGIKGVTFPIEADGAFHSYNILMSENPAWKGVITALRLDPIEDPVGPNIQFAVDYISVHAP